MNSTRAWMLTLLLATSPPVAAQMKHYLRDSIAAWPEASRVRALALLDQCKSAADGFVSIWTEGDKSAIYSATARTFRNATSFEEFARSVDAMRETLGSTKAAEYRNQSITLSTGDTPEFLNDPYVQVVYSVVTTKPNKFETFLEIYLSRDGGMCRVRGFRYQQYWNAIPPWLMKRKPETST